jgi:predicted glycogen debranching enzyme
MQLLRWREAKDTRFPVAKSLPQRLRNSAKHFVFQRPTHLSVIAGYPWFTDWGRDTFISLPGLLLANGQLNDAADVIAGFLSRRSHGLVPNRITDDGSTPEYNSIDATLWAFLAANSWREAGGDRQRLREQFFPAFLEILHTLERGTLFAIQVDPADALLSAGTMETQLTWMDARVYGVPVTPRFGKAVEINALWYNALRLTTDWAREFGDFPAERHFGQLANRAIASFTTLFWNQEKRCLYDVIRLGFRDPKVRPNQLFALSLPYPLLIRSKAEQLLQVVESELLTPFGLRTLSKLDPHFRPRFEGGPEQRDAAYHQGSVWPWLLGPYIRASLRTRGRNPQELARCRQLLDPLLASLDEGCLNQITEVYDGDAPHRPAGAPAQAWSLAEVLSLLTSELSQT